MSRCLWRAHRAGILHRDVKPANLLLPRSGQPAAKLTDFGIARLTAGGEVTPDGSITGTPGSPHPRPLRPRSWPGARRVRAWPDAHLLFSGGRHPFDRWPGLLRSPNSEGWRGGPPDSSWSMVAPALAGRSGLSHAGPRSDARHPSECPGRRPRTRGSARSAKTAG